MSSRRHRALRLLAEALEPRRLLTVDLHLLKDINTETADFAGGSQPADFVEMNGLAFFTAASPNHYREVWQSDGTAAGTVRVSDIPYGADVPEPSPSSLRSTGERVIFTIEDIFGITYSVDGTREVDSAYTFFDYDFGASFLNVVGNELYVNAWAAGLWKTDGTAAGTSQVSDVFLGYGPSESMGVGDSLFFVANESGEFDGQTSGVGELWISDGTAAGTRLVKDIAAGDATSDPQSLTNVNGTLFFTADDGSGRELWKSDGTEAGTVRVKDIASGPEGSLPMDLTNVGGTVYFTAVDTGNGRELWKSDGTAPGTTRVRDIIPGEGSSDPSELTDVNGTVFFAATDTNGDRELWQSAGTAATTVRVADIQPGIVSSNPTALTEFNNALYFVADDGLHGNELWTSDGTESGTQLIRDIAIGPASSEVSELASIGSTLFFAADDGTTGHELWSSDGTTAGTALLKVISAGTKNAEPADLLEIDGTLAFSAKDADGIHLWSSDGTDAGTTKVSDSARFPKDGRRMTSVGDTVYFAGIVGTSGHGLWKSDGTDAGTTLLKDIYVTEFLLEHEGVLYFAANDGIDGTELWKTDGTVAGTVLVHDVNPGPGSSDPTHAAVFGNRIYFAADDGASGRELWRTDSAATEAFRVKNIQPGSSGSHPTEPVEFNGALYFSAKRSSSGSGLWKSDGTAPGTVAVRDLATPSNLTVFDGLMLFESDGELWRSDGTTAGTVLVKDIQPGPEPSDPKSFVVAADAVYFAANDGVHGAELWKSDGTSGGTVLVKDIFPGAESALPAGFEQPFITLAGDRLYLAANDGMNGKELWSSDGTELGTQLVEDISPGITGSNPTDVAVIDNQLFVVASAPLAGSEIWTGTIGVQPGDFDADGVLGLSDVDALVSAIAGDGSLAFDLNDDFIVDQADLELWLALGGENNLGPGFRYLYGDANLDGFVDALDFIDWNDNKFTNVAAWSAGDFTADGIVDGLDFIRWNDNKFRAASANWLAENRQYVGRHLFEDLAHQNAELSTENDSRSHWAVTLASNGVQLQNSASGRFLTADGTADVITTDTASDASVWTILRNADGSISLQNVSNGRYLDGDGSVDDWNVDLSIAIGNDDGWFVSTPSSTAPLSNRNCKPSCAVPAEPHKPWAQTQAQKQRWSLIDATFAVLGDLELS